MQNKNIIFSLDKLKKFLDISSDSTYAGGGKYEEHPQRPGFYELVYKEGDFEYRDSYTGHSRSTGQEIVRFKDIPIWSSGYGGGMIKGKESLADETFSFLKKALRIPESEFSSFRGPHELKDGDWQYKYDQKGDIEEFSGYEEIFYQGDLVFFHRLQGGLLNHS